MAKLAQAEGSRAFKDGEFDSAASWYGRALGSDDVDDELRVAALCNRSAALAKLGRLEEAAADAARAIPLAPRAPKPYYRHACALRALGRRRQALSTCREGNAQLAERNAQLVALEAECAREAAAAPEDDPAPSSAAAPTAQAVPLLPSAAAAPAAAPAEDETEAEIGAEIAAAGGYAAWCQATGNKLFYAREHGQACAWYGHALSALEAEQREEGDGDEEGGEGAGRLAGSEAGAQPGAQPGVQAGAQAGAQPGVQAGVQAGAQAGAQAGVQAGAQAGVQAGVQAGAQAVQRRASTMATLLSNRAACLLKLDRFAEIISPRSRLA